MDEHFNLREAVINVCPVNIYVVKIYVLPTDTLKIYPMVAYGKRLYLDSSIGSHETNAKRRNYR